MFVDPAGPLLLINSSTLGRCTQKNTNNYSLAAYMKYSVAQLMQLNTWKSSISLKVSTALDQIEHTLRSALNNGLNILLSSILSDICFCFTFDIYYLQKQYIEYSVENKFCQIQIKIITQYKGYHIMKVIGPKST